MLEKVKNIEWTGMSREVQLGWAGVIIGVVGIILSAVGLIGESLALAALGLAFLFAIIAGLSLMLQLQGQVEESNQIVAELHSVMDQPTFTLLNVEKTLTFKDESGDSAEHIDVRTIRTNHRGQTDYWFKEIGSPNLVSNVKIDGKPPDGEIVEGGYKRVCKSSPHPLPWHQSFKSTLTCTVTGAFPEKREAYVHRIVDDTQRVHLKIVFHPDKRCFNAGALLGYGGGSYEPIEDNSANATLYRDEDGKEVELIVENPQRGQHYRIEWEW